MANAVYEKSLPRLRRSSRAAKKKDKAERDPGRPGLHERPRQDRRERRYRLYRSRGKEIPQLPHHTLCSAKPTSALIGEKELNEKIVKFPGDDHRQGSSRQPRQQAKELYDIIVKPMEEDLKTIKAKTIVWSLDGALRYLPIAALYNGKHYLAESYRSVMFTVGHTRQLEGRAQEDVEVPCHGRERAARGLQAPCQRPLGAGPS